MVDDFGGFTDLAVGVARQRLANKIGIEERLMDLSNCRDIETANNR